jgi:hypothetical protein
VADVTANSKSVISTDGACDASITEKDRSRNTHSVLTWLGGQRVGSTKHFTTGLNSVKTLPNHRNNRAGSHVLDQTREEALALEVSVI